MSFLIGYTWSHSIDTASRGSGRSWHQNAHRLRDGRDNSDFNVRQRLTASYVYELPFGRGRPYLSNSSSAVDAILGGWSVNGIATFMTGNGFSARTAGDRSNVGAFPFNRANRSCDGNLPRGQRAIKRYFDTSCFEPNPRGTFGTSGRNVLEIPGLNNWDLSFNKQFRPAEGVRLQFRAEFFNLLQPHAAGTAHRDGDEPLLRAGPKRARRSDSSVRHEAAVVENVRDAGSPDRRPGQPPRSPKLASGIEGSSRHGIPALGGQGPARRGRKGAH